METLTKQQEAEAFALIRKGGPEGELAREQFVLLNQPLIDHIAGKYANKGLEWNELRSAGRVGLLQAVNRFDPSRGLNFSTFACKWIQGEIKHAFAASKQQRNSDCRVRATEEGVPLVFDGEEEALEASPEEEGGELELEEQVSTHSSEKALDWSPCAVGTDNDLVPALEMAIEHLDERHRKVIAMHLGLCGHEQHTLSQIGQALGVSAQRVRELETAAFKELRDNPALQMIFELVR